MKTRNAILVLFILLIFSTISFSQTNRAEQTDEIEIVKVLQQFQDGYIKRDTTIISAPLKDVE
ncbi:MAG: hypothetical protein ABFS32_15480 [Bacteroidota bacterium]